MDNDINPKTVALIEKNTFATLKASVFSTSHSMFGSYEQNCGNSPKMQYGNSSIIIQQSQNHVFIFICVRNSNEKTYRQC